MDFTLTTPIEQTRNYIGFEVVGFSVDLDRNEIIIAYDRLTTGGTRIGEEKAEAVDGPDVQVLLNRAQTLATQNSVSVFKALNYAMHELVRDRLGVTGTINVN